MANAPGSKRRVIVVSRVPLLHNPQHIIADRRVMGVGKDATTKYKLGCKQVAVNTID